MTPALDRRREVGAARGPSAAPEPSIGWPGRALLIALLAGGTFIAVAWAFDPLGLLFWASYASVAALLIVRRPRNVIGWLLLAIAFGFTGTTSRPGIDLAAVEQGVGSIGDELWMWIGSWAGAATFICFFALMLLFPSGRLPAGGWRWASMALIAIGSLLVVVSAIAPTITYSPDGGATEIVAPNPVAVLPGLPIWSVVPSADVTIASILVLLPIGVVTLSMRYRRSTGALRLQLRWLVAAVAFMVGAVVTGLTILAIVGEDAWFAWVPAIVAYPTVPAAIGIAVLRYRLYEIDRLISRTIGWALVSGSLVAVFAGGVLALQAVLAGFTQGQTFAVAASTLVAFALFQPIRRRVQHAVDRRFNRARYDAERTTTEFSGRLRGEVDTASLTTALTDTVHAAVTPTSIGLWLREP
ncbi:MAG: hypothetical protein OEX05_05700 [Chloroflexota bacterium]|nr:hypothetical protein [Chloroflexota bacterium]